MTGQNRSVARQLPAPFREDLFGGSKHCFAPAEPEIVEMSEPESEYVHRMLADDGVPDRQSAIDIAGNPAIQRLQVSQLSRRCLSHNGAGHSSRLGRDRDVG